MNRQRGAQFALELKVMDLHGLDVRRRLLLAMRSRAALSPAARALVEMVEAQRQPAEQG